MLWRTKNPKAHRCCEVLLDQDSREIQETCADEGCTVVEPEPDGSRCPSCNTIGSKVDLITVKALLKPDALRRLDGQDYRFCAGPHCDVVYFDNAAGSLFQKEDLTVRVGQKEDEDPIPLCYCFEFMLSDIRQELATRGKTDIAAIIAAEVKVGHCACEVKNPQGSCCLGNVAKAIKRVEQEIASLSR